MAQIEGGNSGGRETNVELNLVPFIDLMSVCIIFLLLTAVWTQVSMIQIGASIYAKKNDASEPPPPTPEDKISFKLNVKKEGYVVVVNGAAAQIPKVGGNYDETKLKNYLDQVKKKYPAKNDVIISVEDNLVFD